MGFIILFNCDNIIIGDSMNDDNSALKRRTVVVFFTCLIIIISIILINYDNKTELIDGDSKNIMAPSELSDKVKEYYNFYNLIDYDTLINWKIDKTVLMEDDVYYVEGYYVCSNLEGNCVYQDVIGERSRDNSYPFRLYVYLDEEDIYRIDSTYSKDNEHIKKLYEYLEANELIDYANLIRLNITKSELVFDGTYKEYLFEGRYKCIDSSKKCVELQENNQKYNDDSSYFKIYGSFVENDGKISLTGVTRDFSEPLES